MFKQNSELKNHKIEELNAGKPFSPPGRDAEGRVGIRLCCNLIIIKLNLQFPDLIHSDDHQLLPRSSLRTLASSSIGTVLD